MKIQGKTSLTCLIIYDNMLLYLPCTFSYLSLHINALSSVSIEKVSQRKLHAAAKLFNRDNFRISSFAVHYILERRRPNVRRGGEFVQRYITFRAKINYALYHRFPYRHIKIPAYISIQNLAYYHDLCGLYIDFLGPCMVELSTLNINAAIRIYSYLTRCGMKNAFGA